MAKEVILDTNFILTCIRQKIDFEEELQNFGLKIAVPRNVIAELKKLSEKNSAKISNECEIAVKIIKKNNLNILGLPGANVDNSIVNFLKRNNDFAVATLDKEILSKVKNPRVVIRGRKKLIFLR